MKPRVLSIASVAFQTLIEILRAKVLFAFLVFICALAWSSLFVGDLTFESRNEVAMDLSVTGASLFCAVASILISAEFVGWITRSAAHPWLAAGITRAELLIGRWAASALVCLALSSAAPAVLIVLFSDAGFHPIQAMNLKSLMVLLPLETLLLCALASGCAVVLPRAPALSCAVTGWALSHMHPSVARLSTMSEGAGGVIRWAVALLVPDAELYNPRAAEVLSGSVFAAAAVQTFAFSAAYLAIAWIFYRRRNL